MIPAAPEPNRRLMAKCLLAPYPAAAGTLAAAGAATASLLFPLASRYGNFATRLASVPAEEAQGADKGSVRMNAEGGW